jgi:hypothetical protein
MAAQPAGGLRLVAVCNFMSAPSPIKVFLRNLVGEYMSREGKDWSFTTDKSKAYIFDYEADGVADKLVMAWRDFGAVWVAVQVDQKDDGETCDVCARKVRYTDVLFDGTRFVCANCRNDNLSLPSDPRSMV